MAEYNIQMNRYVSASDSYDQLFPKTKTVDVVDQNGDNLDTLLGEKIGSDEKGAANGVASLGVDGKVPSVQLPAMDFAPAGYGLGRLWDTAPSNDANLITGSGFQMATTNVPFGTSWWGILSFVYDNSSATQWAIPQNTSSSYFGSVCKREKRNGTWSVWEWVNPPMAVGVEYRTTERYLGKPVYVKVVDFGTLPNATRKSVSIGVVGFDQFVDLRVSTRNKYMFNIDEPNFYEMYIGETGNIVIHTKIDMTGYSAYVIVKYTKTTD